MSFKSLWIRIVNLVEGQIGIMEYNHNKKKFLEALKFVSKGVLNPKSRARKIQLKRDLEEAMKKWTPEQKQNFQRFQKIEDETFKKIKKITQTAIAQNNVKLSGRPSYDKFYAAKREEFTYNLQKQKGERKMADVLVAKVKGCDIVWKPAFYKDKGEIGTDGLPRKKPVIING